MTWISSSERLFRCFCYWSQYCSEQFTSHQQLWEVPFPLPPPQGLEHWRKTSEDNQMYIYLNTQAYRFEYLHSCIKAHFCIRSEADFEISTASHRYHPFRRCDHHSRQWIWIKNLQTQTWNSSSTEKKKTLLKTIAIMKLLYEEYTL